MIVLMLKQAMKQENLKIFSRYKKAFFCLTKA